MKHSSKKSAGPQATTCKKAGVGGIGQHTSKKVGAAKPRTPRFTGTHTRSGTSRQGSY